MLANIKRTPNKMKNGVENNSAFAQSVADFKISMSLDFKDF